MYFWVSKRRTPVDIMLMIIVVFASLGAVIAGDPPAPLDCSENAPCPRDLIRYCIKGQRQPVYGTCDLRRALCRGAELDPQNLCLLPYPIRCTPPPRPCFLDLRPFCVKGREEPVRGHCALQDAICENAEVDFSESCLDRISPQRIYRNLA